MQVFLAQMHVCAAGRRAACRDAVHYWRVKHSTPAHSYVENRQTDRVDVVVPSSHTENTHTTSTFMCYNQSVRL
ncbi:unnamed protein product [Arctia plantaginis]|uniref:Uncharacterized protein n=1 Tax=Arctia plantaginis TaxID=874455 RepID=A0A8S0Z8S7_ARCPL|nr:unnamed protein product [Arctia plantaginis]CAB3256977.1 unnamed protein product [Arctia plantaginis]